MAERLKDEADRKLEALFRSEPVPDNGFSIHIMKRVRRQIWIRRLSMPVAITIGALIAAKPLMQLAGTIPNLLSIVPDSLLSSDSIGAVSLASLPQSTTVIMGAMLLLAVMMISRMLEE